ncbi:MAG: hypothetical protein LBP88_09125 [Treponema sp.]|jgi:hypothetical protein|nr:hypothetical protein [Treponema sp.]
MTYLGWLSRIVELITIMLLRGRCIRDIRVILNINITKVLKTLKSTKYRIQPKQQHDDCLEIDECWTQVGKKDHEVGLIYAYHRESGGMGERGHKGGEKGKEAD